MASSSSDVYRWCFCGRLATMTTQKEADNYGRRIYCCTKRGTFDVSKPNNTGGCAYLEYYDPPFGDRAEYIIKQLLKEKQELEAHNHALAKYNLKKITDIHACKRNY